MLLFLAAFWLNGGRWVELLLLSSCCVVCSLCVLFRVPGMIMLYVRFSDHTAYCFFSQFLWPTRYFHVCIALERLLLLS